MRPFSSLGLKPFLWASPNELRDIQTRFYEFSRRLHPDRTVSLPDEEREQLESEAAALNADYAKLRDTWKLIEAILVDHKSAGAPTRAKSAAPLALAMEYFELQERFEEEGLNEGVKSASLDLRRRAESEVQSAEALVLEFARRFSYQGGIEALEGTPGSPLTAPWTQSDLESLAQAMDRVRFARSFLRDLQSKFPT